MTSSKPAATGEAHEAGAGATTVLAAREIHRGWGRFLIARLRLGNGQEIDREIEDHGVAVGVLPYDPDRRIGVLVRQLRPPALFASGVAEMLEVPAGRLDTSDPQACAIREVFEEVGIRLHRLEPVVTGWTMPAVSTERIHLFLAAFSPADEIGRGGGLAEDQEYISIERIPLTELAQMADAGGLSDVKTLVLLLSLRHRHPGLFAER